MNGCDPHMKLKRPKNPQSRIYCYDCDFFTFEKQVGAAFIGKCSESGDEPEEHDAWEFPCTAWKAKTKRR